MDLTIDAMQQFGVKVSCPRRKMAALIPRGRAAAVHGQRFCSRGRLQSGSIPGCVGCVVIGGITITGLNPDNSRAIKGHLNILKRCGGKFKESRGGLLTSDRSLLKATGNRPADCPDLGPILFTLGCFCSGETVITTRAVCA